MSSEFSIETQGPQDSADTVAMNAEAYGRFLAAQGLRIVKAGGELWVEKRKCFFENVPPHRQIQVDRRVRTKLFMAGAAVLRYSCQPGDGSPSFEYICDEKDFDLHSLDANGRRRTRRGLEQCSIVRLDFEQLAKEGAAINRSVFQRQGRVGRPLFVDDQLWKKYMLACKSLSNVEAYGAFIEGQLCGFSMTVLVDEYAYLHHTHCYTESLKYSPINALTFLVVKEMLRRPGISCVSQGLESFASLPDVEQFKLSMGFRRRPLGRKIVIHPLARPVFVLLGKASVQRLLPKQRMTSLLQDFQTFSASLQEQPRAVRDVQTDSTKLNAS